MRREEHPLHSGASSLCFSLWAAWAGLACSPIASSDVSLWLLLAPTDRRCSPSASLACLLALACLLMLACSLRALCGSSLGSIGSLSIGTINRALRGCIGLLWASWKNCMHACTRLQSLQCPQKLIGADLRRFGTKMVYLIKEQSKTVLRGLKRASLVILSDHSIGQRFRFALRY